LTREQAKSIINEEMQVTMIELKIKTYEFMSKLQENSKRR